MDALKVMLEDDAERDEFKAASEIMCIDERHGVLPLTWIKAKMSKEVLGKNFTVDMIKNVHGVVDRLDSSGKNRTYAVTAEMRRRFAKETDIDVGNGTLAGVVVDLDDERAFEWRDEPKSSSVKKPAKACDIDLISSMDEEDEDEAAGEAEESAPKPVIAKKAVKAKPAASPKLPPIQPKKLGSPKKLAASPRSPVPGFGAVKRPLPEEAGEAWLKKLRTSNLSEEERKELEELRAFKRRIEKLVGKN